MKKLISCISVATIVLCVSTLTCAVTVDEVAMPAFTDSSYSVNQLTAGQAAPTLSNFAYAGRLNGTAYRTLIYYDVVATMAALDVTYGAGNWSVQYAELRFAPEWVWDPSADYYSFHPVLKPYVFDEVTWSNQNASTAWAAPGLAAGTDYAATPDINFLWDDYGLWLIDVTSIVQGWMDNPSSYNGWLLKADSEAPYRNFRGCSWAGQDINTGGVITLDVIPEPGMFMIVGLALLLKLKRK